jgi:hypothetical protein
VRKIILISLLMSGSSAYAQTDAQPAFENRVDQATGKLRGRSTVAYRPVLLILLAYGLQYYQVNGGPAWIDTQSCVGA